MNFTDLGCNETNSTNASINFTWDTTGNFSVSVHVFNVTRKELGQDRHDEVGCALKEGVDVGGNSAGLILIEKFNVCVAHVLSQLHI